MNVTLLGTYDILYQTRFTTIIFISTLRLHYIVMKKLLRQFLFVPFQTGVDRSSPVLRAPNVDDYKIERVRVVREAKKTHISK